MSRNSSGVYSLPAGNPVTTGTTISSTWANTTLSDIATALTQSIAYNGVTTPIANLPMGGYKLTGLGVATTSGDALSYGNAITASSIVGTSVTDSGLTSGRVTYASTGGLLADSASLTFDGTNLGIANINGATLSLKTGGTTGLYIDASQNVGIGTNSPDTSCKLTINGAQVLGSSSATSNFLGLNRSVSGSLLNSSIGATNLYNSGSQANLEYWNTSGSQTSAIYLTQSATLQFLTASTERMRIDSSGNVGIGTSSPGYLLSVSKNGGGGDSGQLARFTDTSTSNSVGPFHLTMGATNHFAGNPSPVIAGTNGLGFAVGDGSDLAGQRKMMIDSSGNVLVGTTTNINLGKQCVSFPGNAQHGIEVNDTTSTNGSQFITFFTGGSLRGYISNNNNTAVAYNTTSDYRLKENVAPMTGALDTVAQLKPVTYNWKADGSEGQGFIAHELQEVVPDCVTGEKDATRIEQYEISPAIPATYDKEGNELTPAVEAVMGEREVPVYQGIDTSFLVATLTAAIQELSAKVTALEAQVNGNTPSV